MHNRSNATHRLARLLPLGLLGATLTLGGILVAARSALASPAETITVVERQLDVNPGEINPCTGATGTILDDEQDVYHITSLASGAVSLSGHATVDVAFVPDDPTGVRYDGHDTFAFSQHSSSATFTTTMTTHVRVKGSDGSFIT